MSAFQASITAGDANMVTPVKGKVSSTFFSYPYPDSSLGLCSAFRREKLSIVAEGLASPLQAVLDPLSGPPPC